MRPKQFTQALTFSTLALGACAAPAREQAPVTTPAPVAPPVTITPVPRDERWQRPHTDINAQVAKAAQLGQTRLIFVGDSITEQWMTAGKADWEKFVERWHAINMGIGGDRTQHVLWRLDHGNVDGLDKPAQGAPPALAIVMIGTNNLGTDSAPDIALGIEKVVQSLRAKLPTTKVLVLSILPRGKGPNAPRDKAEQVNRDIEKLADGQGVFVIDIGDKLTEPDGTIKPEIMPDYLHLSPKGYAIMAKALNAAIETIVEDKRDAAKAEFPLRCEVHLRRMVKQAVPVRYGWVDTAPLSWDADSQQHFPHAVDFVYGFEVPGPQSPKSQFELLCPDCFKAAGRKWPEPAQEPQLPK